ncbi:unnamed protein product [Anisakis simplex]|uniref:Multidrug resistance-associated protein 4 (inferred by orthology to a human protein) n=1 Tax=Anisakis simplex TaxID=6269 RepID=A0A158PN60_ANISI|nr:unnamed protein product [Anisakis simplex]
MDTVARYLCAQDHFEEVLNRSAITTWGVGGRGDSVEEFLETNPNLTSLPHLSECAQSTVLVFIPSLFIFMLCPLVLYRLSKSDNGSLHAVSFFNSLYEWKVGLTRTNDSILSLFPKIFQYLSICLVLVLMIACRNRGLVTSGEEDDVVRMSSSRLLLCLLSYPLIVLELVLSCFADTPKYKIVDKKMCPEESSSFLNQITFNWFHQLAVKGNKRALQVSDLWKLNTCDESRNLMPDFNKNWKPTLQAYYDRKQAAMHETPPRILTDSDTPSILWPLFRTYFMKFLGGASLKFIFDILHKLISFTENRSQPLWVGVSIAMAMFIVALFQSFVLHQYFHTMFTLGMNIRSVLTSAVYAKALSLSNSARKNRTIGEIVNLMSVDIQRFQDMTSFVMLFWSAPLQVILSIYFLWRLLGISVIAGLFILIAMIPFNSWISVKMRNCQVQQMKYKDERLKLMSEILNGIKVLKLYAWENSMERIVLEIRRKEIGVLKKLAFYNAAITLSWSCAPFLVAVLTFGVYVNLDPHHNLLTPQVTFVGLSLFNILRFPLAVFAMIFSQAIQCTVSNKRLKSFLADDEMRNVISETHSKSDDVISLRNANFAWDSSELTLKNINLNVKKGELIAIVGSVGCGKSSLLSAILGEMDKESGEVSLRGSVAYVPQQAWIQNMSLRANILFGRSFSSEFYDLVMEGCALKQDLSTLPAGDNTEIGEKGINLSGGQKQRVSLARAVYSNSDIVLLDDPLSAVDAHVGKHIFEHIIANKSGLLAGKTRLLVTHGLHYLKRCDRVIVLKDGTVSEIGTYEELMASEGAFADFLEEFLLEEAKHRARSVSFGEQAEDVDEVLKELERYAPGKSRRIQSQMSSVTYTSSEEASNDECRSHSTTPSSPSSPVKKGVDMIQRQQSNKSGTRSLNSVNTKEVVHLDHKRADGGDLMRSLSSEKEKLLLATADSKAAAESANEKSKLIEKEGVEIGKVKWTVYMAYINAIGYMITLIFLSIYVLSSILGVMSNLWLAAWSDHAKEMNASSPEEHDTNVRLSIYASLGTGQAVSICAASIIMALGMVHASRTLHEGILRNILHSPMQFFDVTPIGRILNRFGKDVEIVDFHLPESGEEFLGSYQEVIVTCVIVIAVLPQTLIPFCICFVVFTLVLDVDVVDTTLPSCIRSFIATGLNVIVTVVVILYATPAFSTVIPLLSFVYYMVLDVEILDSRLANSLMTVIGCLVQAGLLLHLKFQRFYVSTSRQLKRLESTTRSPIYSHFQESVQGAACIRAYQCIDRFIGESQNLVDNNLVTYYPSIVANRWLAVRLELIGNLIVLCSAIFAVLYRDYGTVTAGLIGLSVSYALNITQTLNWAVRMTSDLETNIVAVERIKEYSESPTEGSPNEYLLKKPIREWPLKGEIKFENLFLKYRENLDYVLRDLNAFIKGGEKIGIVGRTGAGKTSLTLALFRIVEAESGRILIDGEDISQLPLEVLRSRLTIVPQVIIIRQLICLARALLRKTKILILDEAAASVDMETDQLIQKTIREQFAKCTVLTIAHRLNTVIDSDRLLVLDSGRVREFDSPKNLLGDRQSLFYSMALEAGIVSEHEHLKEHLL